MSRRIFAPVLTTGSIQLIDSEAHHLRDVLRLKEGDTVELFDEAGRTATGVVLRIDRRAVVVEAESPHQAPPLQSIIVASAVPKGDRAEWMVEKLSEIGVTGLILLITDRGIVVPKGDNKLDRFRRISIESAKQSHRTGVMTISAPMPLSESLRSTTSDLRLVLTTQGHSRPISQLHSELPSRSLSLFIGPEGGWTEDELQAMQTAGLTAVSLTTTILRVETAAVVAAAIAACMGRGNAKG